MKHPLAFLPPYSRKPVFVGLLAWTLTLMAISQVINAPLRTPVAPTGIISFELAHSPANARAIIASWDPHLQLLAAFGLGFDYLFMPSYAFAISLACLLVAGRQKGWFPILSAYLGWGMFLAAIFDAVENVGLWNSLIGNTDSAWPGISFWCAGFKFALILLGIVFGLIGWILTAKESRSRG